MAGLRVHITTSGERKPTGRRAACTPTQKQHSHTFRTLWHDDAAQDLDDGKLPMWSGLAAPPIGKRYWKLAPDATMRDLLLAIRADEVGGWLGRCTTGRARGAAVAPRLPVMSRSSGRR